MNQATECMDAMGYPFSSWLVARRNPDGTAMRNERGHQIFEAQAKGWIRCNGVAWGVTCPRRADCVHHQAHQAVPVGQRPRNYDITDSRAGWTLFACASTDDLDRFGATEAAPTPITLPALGQTMDLFA
jgi:hypothetical protein